MVVVQQSRARLRQWQVTLTAVPEAVAEARRDVRSLLKGWGWEGERADDFVSICSELVTNAIQHASQPGGEVGLRVQEIAGDCRIEVLDGRPDLTVPRTSVPRGENGRGLILVRQLADDMAVATSRTTKKVWARVLLAAEDTPRSTP
ncbi:ATP-binding protein [Kitasatospora cinereorecta]|uniref:ATP-binding protein n=1 Tax=Kitasatospora cinereorecta TaxID=285560 RepID=A0ABW0V962_9ACTN